MIYLDTHVVLWLYALKGKRLSKRACQLIEESATIFISSMVLLWFLIPRPLAAGLPLK